MREQSSLFLAVERGEGVPQIALVLGQASLPSIVS